MELNEENKRRISDKWIERVRCENREKVDRVEARDAYVEVNSRTVVSAQGQDQAQS